MLSLKHRHANLIKWPQYIGRNIKTEALVIV